MGMRVFCCLFGVKWLVSGVGCSLFRGGCFLGIGGVLKGI
ncbi:hypothetical protein ES703_25979 [subsurface metagenome]